MNHAYIALFILFVVLFTYRRRRMIKLKQLMKMRLKEERTEMKEIAARFIDKECIIYTLDSQVTGTVKEVVDGAVWIENDGACEAVNLDFVVRIREYPRKKNGKKKALVLD